MAIILPERIGLAESLGEALGSGIQSYAHTRLQDLLQRNQRQQSAMGLQQLLGLQPGEAQGLSFQSPEVQSQFVKQRLQQPQNEAYAQALNSLIGGGGTGTTQTTPLNLQSLNAQQATKLGEIALKQRESAATREYQKERLALQKQEQEHKRSQKLEELNLKKQETLAKQNEPYLKELEQKVPVAMEAKEYINDIKNLLDTGKVQSGITGAITSGLPFGLGTPLQNKETQDFASAINKLVILEAQRGKGLPSKFRLLLEQAAKPGLNQRPEVQKAIINRLDRQVQDILLEDEARSQVVEENGGTPPVDLKKRTLQRKRMLEKLQNQSSKQLNSVLGDADKYEIGTEVEQDGQIYRVIGDKSGAKWEVVG